MGLASPPPSKLADPGAWPGVVGLFLLFLPFYQSKLADPDRLLARSSFWLFSALFAFHTNPSLLIRAVFWSGVVLAFFSSVYTYSTAFTKALPKSMHLPMLSLSGFQEALIPSSTVSMPAS